MTEDLVPSHTYFRPDLRWRETRHAIWAGRRDGKRGIPPFAPGHGVGGARLADPSVAWTPYILKVKAEADSARSELAGSLMAENKQLLVRLHDQAHLVIRQHRNGGISDSAQDRFEHGWAQWRVVAAVYLEYARMAFGHANQLLGVYWQALSRHHVHLHGQHGGSEALRPPELRLEKDRLEPSHYGDVRRAKDILDRLAAPPPPDPPDAGSTDEPEDDPS